MAFDDLQEFLTALEKDGDLSRVRVPVDPQLEVTGIVERVVRAGGPALLFENPTRGRLPLAINVFGTPRRMARALGVSSLDEVGQRIGELLKPELPRGVGGLRDALSKVGQLRAAPPRQVRDAPCHDVILRGSEVDLDILPGIKAWPADGGVFLNLGLTHTKDPVDRCPQPRHVSPAAAGLADGVAALADPQGLDVARRDRRAPR